MLPKASVSFNIPSVYDSTILNCRLYYPKRQKGAYGISKLKAAIVAHPYATLGGCYDDPVVAMVGNSLLRAGYFLMTFNFRGAKGSAGRTSWSGKPELADYVSVYGFMLRYLDSIRTLSHLKSCTPALLLAGYSYGSMITSHLPDLHVVFDEFEGQAAETPAAQIGLRALEMSQEYIALIQTQQLQESDLGPRGRQSLHLPNSPTHSVALGGSESLSADRRRSRESSRASFDLDGVKRSMHRIRDKLEHRRSSGLSGLESSEDGDTSKEQTRQPIAQVRYLLVSPLLPPVTGFTTMFSKLSFTPTVSKKASPQAQTDHELIHHPTCAIYGDNDVFTSHKKLRRWVEDCQRKSKSEFAFFEIAGTGHFWHEEEAEEKLKAAVASWIGHIETD